ncbi:MAG: hypothetical protein R3A10_23015 [Caldilineaceae bacterium]
MNLVQVTAPDINCVFDGDCTITADSSDTFTLPGGTGDGLQSLWPAGEVARPARISTRTSTASTPPRSRPSPPKRA